MSGILGYLTGRAAKAGMALVTGAITTAGGAGVVDHISDAGMSLLGYVVIGALGGAINWATVYFKANKPEPKPTGLY